MDTPKYLAPVPSLDTNALEMDVSTALKRREEALLDADHKEKPFPFMRLPSELRLMVYKNLVHHRDSQVTVHLRARTYRSKSYISPPPPPITSVSRTARNESLCLYWKLNVFQILIVLARGHKIGSEWRPNELLRRWLVRCVTRSYIPCLTKIELVPYPWIERRRTLETFEAIVCLLDLHNVPLSIVQTIDDSQMDIASSGISRQDIIARVTAWARSGGLARLRSLRRTLARRAISRRDIGLEGH